MKRLNILFTLFLILFLLCSKNSFLQGEVKKGELLSINLQTGTTGAVKGVVKNAENKEPIENAEIILIYSKNKSMKFDLQTDKDGTFYKGGLRPGYYKLSVEKENFLPISRMVRMLLGETVQEDFQLQSLESQVPIAVKSAKSALQFYREGNWEKAIKEFSKAIRDNPSNHVLFFYRGSAQEKLDQIKKALSDFQKAIDINPDFESAYSSAAKLFARQQNYKKAIELYQKSIELDDKDVTTLYNYSVVLINTGKNLKAVKTLEKLLSLDKEYADAYYRLGMLYIGQGNTKMAKNHLKKFIDLVPEDKNAPIARKVIERLK